MSTINSAAASGGFNQVTACLLAEDDIDTDAIIPQTELVTTTKAGLGKGLFARWRYDDDRNPLPGFPLNHANSRQAKVLIAGRNFGCGSSREHAVWALKDWGIDAVLALSFGEIFYRNSVRNALLPGVINEATYQCLVQCAAPESRHLVMSLDLDNKLLLWDKPNAPKSQQQRIAQIQISDEDLTRIVQRQDDIDMTLKYSQQIKGFESRYLPAKPWLPVTANQKA